MARKKWKSSPIDYAAISRSFTLAARKYKRNPEKFLKNIIYGDVEWPEIPEGDRLKELPEKPDKLAKEQFVWLVGATEYVLRQLDRWIQERLTLELMYYYNKLDTPFTTRLIAIGKPCEQVLDVLPAILPAFQQRFREMYKRLTQAASKADSTRLDNLEDSINNFKSASENFHSTVITIHSEVLVALKADLAEKPAEKGGNAAPTKCGRIKDFFWMLYEKALKVIVDAAFERWGPK